MGQDQEATKTCQTHLGCSDGVIVMDQQDGRQREFCKLCYYKQAYQKPDSLQFSIQWNEIRVKETTLDVRKNRLGIDQAELRNCGAVYCRVADDEAEDDNQNNNRQ